MPNNAKNKKVTWKSSNTSIATVDSSGKVTGKKAGTVTITATTSDGGKKATCKVTVLKRKAYSLTAGKHCRLRSRLNKNFCMDVMRISTTKNTNVSLYKYDKKRSAEKFLIKKVKVGKNYYYALTIRSNGRAVSEVNGNIVQGVYKGTNWQLFKVYRFNDSSVQLINRASQRAPSVVSGRAETRSNISSEVASLSANQR